MARSEAPGPLVWTLPEPPRSRAPGLSRERILRAAMSIADGEGLPAATMRRVATEVGSNTPMSLYRYVGSKDGLADLMIDAVYGEVELPARPSEGWRADLRRLGVGLWRAAIAHPWWASLSHTRPPLGPNALRCTEFGLAALDGIGLEIGAMMTYLSMVNGHVVGTALQAVEEEKMRTRAGLQSDDDLRAVGRELSAEVVPPDRFPTYTRWLKAGMPYDLTSGSGDPFETGLDIVLDGIAAHIRDR